MALEIILYLRNMSKGINMHLATLWGWEVDVFLSPLPLDAALIIRLNALLFAGSSQSSSSIVNFTKLAPISRSLPNKWLVQANFNKVYWFYRRPIQTVFKKATSLALEFQRLLLTEFTTRIVFCFDR